MTDGAATAFMFGRFVLDVGRGLLLEDGVERALRAKSTTFLRHLAENPGRLVSRDEIMAVVWPGLFVSNENVDQCVKEIRRALGDASRRMLRTIPKRGFVFTPEVSLAAASGPAADPRPSIAVLPFQNLGDDVEQDYFVDGMVEEIVTALSRIGWLLVHARGGGFAGRQRGADVAQIGRGLGVTYVLDGAVRRAGQTLRITGQLIDAETGAHLWADRFEGSLQDAFELQDKVAASVAGVIEPTVQAAETARRIGRPTEDFAAYDFYLRGHALFLSSALQMAPALQLLEQAIERDPQYGIALALAAMCCQRLVGDNRSNDPARDRLKSLDYAKRALEAAPADPAVLVNAAIALSYFGEDIGAMLALVDRALALNPNFARGWHISGHLRLRAGLIEEAIEHTERSLRLSPRARVGNNPFVTIGAAHFYARRFDPAVAKLLVAIQEDPGNPNPYRYLAAAYAYQDRHDEAAEVIERLRAVTETLIPDLTYLRNDVYREFFMTGLHAAIRAPAGRAPASGRTLDRAGQRP